MNHYAQRVTFAQDQDLRFPDFILRYTGTTRVVRPPYPHGFTYYHFTVKSVKVRQGGQEVPETQEVRWSSGTGDIAPQGFSVAGETFLLELKISDTLGILAAEELVITKSGGVGSANEARGEILKDNTETLK